MYRGRLPRDHAVWETPGSERSRSSAEPPRDGICCPGRQGVGVQRRTRALRPTGVALRPLMTLAFACRHRGVRINRARAARVSMGRRGCAGARDDAAGRRRAGPDAGAGPHGSLGRSGSICRDLVRNRAVPQPLSAATRGQWSVSPAATISGFSPGQRGSTRRPPRPRWQPRARTGLTWPDLCQTPQMESATRLRAHHRSGVQF